MKIHHTMGLYLDGSRKHNGVAPEDLEAHITYNLNMRPGRAFFVDDKCLNTGYYSAEGCALVEAELAANPVVMKKVTRPYC